MPKPTDVRPVAADLYFLPTQNRMPLKFGSEIVKSGKSANSGGYVARTRMVVRDAQGREAEGWGETPLSVTWVWPSSVSQEDRAKALQDLCVELAKAWADFAESGHPMEVGNAFQEQALPKLHKEANAGREGDARIPWLAALVCCSLFDIALHDAYGNLHGVPVYDTYNAQWMNRDLAAYLTPAEGAAVSFEGRYPEEFLVKPPPQRLAAWHLVGGSDPLTQEDLTGDEPDDEYPVLLADWIRADGLKCLKIKLCGTDAAWDYERIVRVAEIAEPLGVEWLTADFNCTVKDPAYVNEILDKLVAEHPRAYGMILYVEQPFPYDLEANRIDVHSVSARKPLFMDESAHDWHLVKLGRSLGWTGVALKTCKTQTGALLSLCWAKAHGMTLMVQDLTNPMLAQIPHCLLAAYAGTIMGVETNSMQFRPDASVPEAKVHPGLYQRREGCVDLSTLKGSGFGYRVGEIERQLPEAAVKARQE